MKKSYSLLLCLFALAACNKAEDAHTVTTPAAAVSVSDSMPLLARENNCTACHTIDKKLVGPAWRDVARKYKGDPTAPARLLIKVSKGGDGVWGTMPMPANDAIGKKQDQMKQLVAYILTLDK